MNFFHSLRYKVSFQTIVFLLTLFCSITIYAKSEFLKQQISENVSTPSIQSLKLAMQQSKLIADDATGLDFFGFSVSLSGNRALIGVRGKRAAYIYELTNGTWTQTAKLVATDVAFNFGVSVSLSGDRALIGANQSASLAGAAYIFDFANGNWTQTAKLIANDAAAGDQFGVSVNLSVDNRALIGAPFDDPDSPNQQCIVDPRTAGGSINGADVVISVICTTIQYNLGVTVNGLAIGNSIELTSNGQSLMFNSDGSANFSAAIDDGSDYGVVLTSQPTTPSQFCNMTGGSNGDGSGTFAGTDVLVAVTCSVLELTIDNRLLDFGTVITGISNSQIVTLSNNGSGTVIITEHDSIQHSCFTFSRFENVMF